MDNEREKIWENFTQLSLNNKLEVLKMINNLNHWELTYQNCVFYEFEEFELERYFSDYTTHDVVNIIRKSKIKDKDKYFHANSNDPKYIISCNEKFIEYQIDKNKELIIKMTSPYISEIKEDLGIYLDYFQESIRLGDYLSFEDSNGDHYLTQIIEIKDEYVLINVDTFKIQGIMFDNLSEINDLVLEIDATLYYVDHESKMEIFEDDLVYSSGRYLVYDKDCGGDFEVVITYNGTNDIYNIMNATLDSFFYEEDFESYCETMGKLLEDYSIVKRLRD